MLSRNLIGALLFEISLYVFLIWYNYGADPLDIALLIAAIALGYRAVVILGMFAIAESWKCKRPDEMKIGLLGALRLFLAEWWAYTRLYALYHPFAGVFGRLDAPSEAHASGDAILLVHGFSCNAAYWRPMQKALDKAGIRNTWTISLEPLNGDIERLADQLAARVEDVCAKCGAEKVTLVGHSMGGLVSRTYARRQEGAQRVTRIISLGSPHHGTIHSQLSKARNARQMRINNDWLNELNVEEEHPPLVPIASVFSYHDNIVSPQDSPMLKHAENFAFAGVGHLEMSFSKAFQQKVIGILMAGGK